ncbi:alpha/beta fold hydrolase [Streptomyces sp. NPDC048639]|uniref:alpha/beta fold hydrolase n=1 Tax=Streptomyces sp. NPDC048639 TaxID=3365581 RepID=UPI00371C0F5A
MNSPETSPTSRRTALICASAAVVMSLTPTPVVHASVTQDPIARTSAPGVEPPRFAECPADVPTPPAPERIECATLHMPLDRHRPDGPRIDLAVSRIAASGPPSERRGVLLVNPGGPGGSGVGYAATKRAKLPASVRRSFDVIGFDPRGTGRSSPADCGDMGGLFDAPGADPVPRGAAAERAHRDMLRRTADDCAAGTRAALPHLDTENTAHDMDVIRAALGEQRISFLGVSYGSYLGAAYAAHYPRRVDRMVLDSVVGPEDWHDFDQRQARAMLRQRMTFFDWVAAHSDRFRLGTTRASVRAAYARARHGLASRPVDGFGPAEFDRAVYRALGRTERWTGLGDGIRGYLTHGSVEGLRPAEPFEGSDSRRYEAANRAVKCADGPGPSPSRVAADLHRLRTLDPMPVLTGMESWACAYWHHRPSHRTALGSPDAPPLLLIASAHDPVTPVSGAHALRRKLPGSRIVTLHDDFSHGVFASRGNACVDGTAAAYLVDGTVPRRDVDCQGPGLPDPAQLVPPATASRRGLMDTPHRPGRHLRARPAGRTDLVLRRGGTT